MAGKVQQSLGELILEELKLIRSQWEERPVQRHPRDGLEDQYLEIDCLVGWLKF